MARQRTPNVERLYGTNSVTEALNGRREHRRLIVVDQLASKGRVREVIDLAAQCGIGIEQQVSKQVDRLVDGANHQGVVLETSPFPYLEIDDVLQDQRTILLLDHLNDPQNLATLMRTAAAAGVGGILIPDRRAAGITPAVVNASAGTVEHLRVALIGNPRLAVERCQDAGYWSVALDQGDDTQMIFKANIPVPALWIVGSEGAGVSRNLRQHADLVVSIPMPGGIESLNAAVAGSIAIYESVRREMAQ